MCPEKGLPAALFTAMTKTLVRNRLQGQTRAADVVQRANRLMCADNPSNMFVSLFLAVLDIHTGRLIYTNAGHNPPLVKRADGGLLRLDQRNGPVMGVSEAASFTESELMLQVGNTLLVYTDGVTEAADGRQRLFSEARLSRLLSEDGNPAPEALVQSVLESVNAYQQGVSPADDMTLLALRFRGNAFSYDI